MNNKELQAIRSLLMISVKEAADHIGNVSARTWQRWEDGSYNVPDDVAEKMAALAVKRLLGVAKQAGSLELDYYMSLEEYKLEHIDGDLVGWRISQSVAAYFFGEGAASLR